MNTPITDIKEVVRLHYKGKESWYITDTTLWASNGTGYGYKTMSDLMKALIERDSTAVFQYMEITNTRVEKYK